MNNQNFKLPTLAEVQKVIKERWSPGGDKHESIRADEAQERQEAYERKRNRDPYYPRSYYEQDMMDDTAPADGLADSVETE